MTKNHYFIENLGKCFIISLRQKNETIGAGVMNMEKVSRKIEAGYLCRCKSVGNIMSAPRFQLAIRQKKEECLWYQRDCGHY
jgi:hypothetical protein